MNKTAFKSAYGKIALSEEFKAQAREKLHALAQGLPAETAQDDIPEAQAKEIIIPKKKRSSGRIFAGIGAAAAVVAIAAVGGVYLKNANPLNSNSNSIEESDKGIHSDKGQNDSHTIEGVVGSCVFSLECETALPPEQAQPTATELVNGDMFSQMNFDVSAVSSGKRGGTVWTEYNTDSGRFVVNSGSCLDSEVEYIPLADGTVIVPQSYAGVSLISPQDYKTQNYLSYTQMDLLLCEKSVDNEVYYSAEWTAEDGSRCHLSAQGLTEGEIADIIAMLIYGESSYPQSFGTTALGLDSSVVSTNYGTLNISPLAYRPEELTVPAETQYRYQDPEFYDYYERFDYFDLFYYNLPFAGEECNMEYSAQSDSTESLTTYFMGVVDVSQNIELTILHGDYGESTREYCAAAFDVTRSFRDTDTDVFVCADYDTSAITTSTVTTYQAEWQDENGDYYTLVTTGISLDEMSYVLAQIVEKNNCVIPTAIEKIETDYGAVRFFELTPGYEYAIPIVYNSDVGRNEITKFVGSEILTEIEMPFDVVEHNIVYDAFDGSFDFSEIDINDLDPISAELFDASRGVFLSDNCPLFNNRYFDTKEIVADYIGEGEKGVTINVLSSLGNSMLVGAGINEYEMANNTLECENDCSKIYFAKDASEVGAYYAVFQNKTLDKYIRVNSHGISVEDFVGIVYALCNVQQANADYSVDDSGNIEYSLTTNYSDINFGVKLDGQKLEQALNYPSFSGTADEIRTAAAETTGFEGVAYIGDGVFNVLCANGFALDSGTSIVVNDNGTLISLHYLSDSGEMYINFADEEHLNDIRRVTDSDGRSWIIEGGDSGACFIPSRQYLNACDFLSGNDPTNNTWLGGKEVDGTLYYEGFRRTSGIPSEALFITVSAKGMLPREFANVMSVLIQSSWINSNRTIVITPAKEVETDNGTLLINGGTYYGTGAGYMHDVSSEIYYTYDDVLDFCGADYSNLEMPFETNYSSLTYNANYAEFHSDANLGLFRTGQPLEGEENDEVFQKAHEYFVDYMYTYDKLEYFADKTLTVKEYMLQYYNGADYNSSTKWVNIKLLDGDFSERYKGTGFETLNPTPSEGFCEDYFNAHRDDYEQGTLSRVYACEYNGFGESRCYGGFMKNGVYMTVETYGISYEEFADILAQIYTG